MLRALMISMMTYRFRIPRRIVRHDSLRVVPKPTRGFAHLTDATGTISEVIGAATIVVLLIWATGAILMPVYAHEPGRPRKGTYQAPDIPQCDKELWLRIKDGCDD